ncbi:hypothetical protein B7494_g6345 [Chlorociboria aeruginascens]|nr:hypothetical protein B7494_g6345 [Chlorociboria aeruginascens]
MSEETKDLNIPKGYEEEEEVEISDDEGVYEEIQQEGENKEQKPISPEIKKSGKVTPSKEVLNMKMKLPETPLAKKYTLPTPTPEEKKQTLPTNKNPFTTFGSWTSSTMGKIEILMPVLTAKNKTTNDLTRKTKPEARYWKAPISFKHGNYSSTTIRFDNVPIPFYNGRGYGSKFVYLCLPGFAADYFAEAGKSRRLTVSVEKSLKPDKNRW